MLAFMLGCKKETTDDPIPDKVHVSSVTLDKTTLELIEGDTHTLIATVSPSDASNKRVSWESSNTAVASVSDEGLVTAIKAGTATITATTIDGGKTATCRVTIKAKTIPVESVTLDKATLELIEGDTHTLIATVSPSDASNKRVSWESSNTAVASVSDEGLVTAIKAGTATITATTIDGGKTATCSVTIKAKTGVNADIDDWGDGNDYSGSVD